MPSDKILEVLEGADQVPGDRLASGGGLLDPALEQLSEEELELLQEASAGRVSG